MIVIEVDGTAPPLLLRDVAAVLGEFPGDHEAEVAIVGTGGRVEHGVKLAGRYSAAPVVLGMVKRLEGVLSVALVAGR